MTSKSSAARTLRNKQTRKPKADTWVLRLHVAGQRPRGRRAMNNLEKICEEHLHGEYQIEIVDLLVNPRLARDDQIVAIPTLVRWLPMPIRKIIGDLSNTEKVLVGLQLRPQSRIINGSGEKGTV